jgi:hypothetical protein
MKLGDWRAVAALASFSLLPACGRSKPSASHDGAADSRGVDGVAATDAIADASHAIADGPADGADDAPADAPAAETMTDASTDGAGADAEADGGPDGDADVHAGFTLVLDEEFESPLDLDTDPVWTWGDGAPEPGYTRFVKEAISFSGGKLVITSTRPTGGVPAGTSYSQPARNMDTAMIPAKMLASGELRTRLNNFRYGRYETRATFAAMPSGLDAPIMAAMFVDRQPEWQQWREIDLELENNLPHAVAYNLLDTNGTTFAPSLSGNVQLGEGFSPFETHDYSFTWLPDRIEWSVDGVVVKSTVGNPTALIPALSAKIHLNLWTIDLAPLTAAASAYPVSISFDYFRFWRWDADTSYPCAPTPACLTADDRDFARNNASEP